MNQLAYEILILLQNLLYDTSYGL